MTETAARRGKAARATAPRSSHAHWEPAPGRVDPVEMLRRQAQTRTPELTPIRHGRMVRSPFAFFRGAAAIMAADIAGARLEVEQQFARRAERADAAGRRRLDTTLTKVRGKDSLRAVAKLTREVDGSPRFASNPPLIVPLDELVPAAEVEVVKQRLHGFLRSYARTLQPDRRHLFDAYRPVDIAHKVVGVGSVGTRAWIVLLLGRDASDPLVLQIKEAQRSVLEPYAARSRQANQGRRVVEGQRMMQAASDVFLGWLRIEEDVGDAGTIAADLER